MCAQLVADHLFPPAHGGFDPGTFHVARRFLPSHSTVLGDVLDVAVARCRRGLGRIARHGRHPRRHDHGRRGMALGDAGVNAVLVVGAVARERRQRSCHLVKQGVDLGRIGGVFGGQRRGHDLASAGVHAEMQRPP